MERLWKKQVLSISTNRSTYRAMSGNFQRQVCWDSAGYVYVLTAEDNGAGNTKRISVYRSVNGLFDLSGGFTFQADTSIANGYPADEIRDLTEFSAVLRNDKIYIIARFSDAPTVISGVVLITYDINDQTFTKTDYMASSGGMPSTPVINSVDISVAKYRAHGDIIASWLEYNQVSNPLTMRRRYLREILPLFSAQGSGGIGNITESISGGAFHYPCFLNNFDGDNELWGVMKTQMPLLTASYSMVNLPRESMRGTVSGLNNITLGSSNAQDFGNFKALYNEKFNLEVMAHWRRLDAPKAGWELDLGIRGQEGIFKSFEIVEFDYTHLGVSDVLSDIPNVCPEVLLMLDDQGGIYVLGSYPNPGSRPLNGTPGAGRIDNPFYNVAMAYWASDNFDDLSGANYETVWNGANSQTQIRYLSAPDIFPAGDSLTIRSSKLFFTAVDTVNDPTGHVVIYRD
jgi:hypothetical protein